MKISNILFIILVFLIAFKYTKVFDISYLMIGGAFLIWFLTIYVRIHIKNKDRNTPRPVYLAD